MKAKHKSIMKKKYNQNDFESPFMVALLESLKKRGITYEEYKKSFQEDD